MNKLATPENIPIDWNMTAHQTGCTRYSSLNQAFYKQIQELSSQITAPVYRLGFMVTSHFSLVYFYANLRMWSFIKIKIKLLKNMGLAVLTSKYSKKLAKLK